MFFQQNYCRKSQKGVKFNRNKSQKGAEYGNVKIPKRWKT